MAAKIVDGTQRVIPLSNQPDKCSEQRLCWVAELTFAVPGDVIELSINSSNGPNQPQFDVVRGIFVFLRARADSGSGATAWLKVEIPITGQRWDLGTPTSISPWNSTTMSVPVYMPAQGVVKLTYNQGDPVANGDCVVILTNFEVEPYIVIGSSSNEVG